MKFCYIFFQNATRGLFGNWSNNSVDDFTLPDSSTARIVKNLNTQRVYNKFGRKWRLNDSVDLQKGQALFVKEYGH